MLRTCKEDYQLIKKQQTASQARGGAAASPAIARPSTAGTQTNGDMASSPKAPTDAGSKFQLKLVLALNADR